MVSIERWLRCVLLALAVVGAAPAAVAADPAPEIQRPAYSPQAPGVVHTVRVIPEACMLIEGHFTGQAGTPYALAARPSRARCMARARLVDAASVRPAPSAARGWVFNDLIPIPNAGCPGQQAVVRIWREGRLTAVPTRDAQGRVRVYLKDAMEPASAQAHRDAMPRYVAELEVQGQACQP